MHRVNILYKCKSCGKLLSISPDVADYFQSLPHIPVTLPMAIEDMNKCCDKPYLDYFPYRWETVPEALGIIEITKEDIENIMLTYAVTGMDYDIALNLKHIKAARATLENYRIMEDYLV